MQTKIILLEDELILGKLYKKNLEKAGFNVKWINKIKNFQAIVFDFQPEVIILDNSINGENQSGMEIIPELKKILPKSRIIMLSNYSDFHLKEEALSVGADDYLVKIDTSPKKLVFYIQKKIL